MALRIGQNAQGRKVLADDTVSGVIAQLSEHFAMLRVDGEDSLVACPIKEVTPVQLSLAQAEALVQAILEEMGCPAPLFEVHGPQNAWTFSTGHKQAFIVYNEVCVDRYISNLHGVQPARLVPLTRYGFTSWYMLRHGNIAQRAQDGQHAVLTPEQMDYVRRTNHIL